MKKRNLIIGGVLAAGLLTAVAAGAVSAHGYGDLGRGCGGPRATAFDGAGPHGMLRGLSLTDEQRDKIFNITYAQQPAVRDKIKELRKEREGLREATLASSYDAKKVRELANAQAKTMSDLIAMRAETFNRIYGVLTPEQQQVVKVNAERRGRPGW